MICIKLDKIGWDRNGVDVEVRGYTDASTIKPGIVSTSDLLSIKAREHTHKKIMTARPLVAQMYMKPWLYNDSPTEKGGGGGGEGWSSRHAHASIAVQCAMKAPEGGVGGEGEGVLGLACSGSMVAHLGAVRKFLSLSSPNMAPGRGMNWKLAVTWPMLRRMRCTLFFCP